jgi:tetratricopeptide (TPR) repeat protein
MKNGGSPVRVFALTAVIALASCAGYKATTAEEYFSLGMAYFDLGKAAADANTRLKYFQESEKWLNRARMIDRTQTASEYNIGRIAFETGRYEDAAASFEKILRRDPDNVLALRAASYTRIKTGDTELAEAHYKKLLTLVPENADDGYNYALVLYAIEKYEAAEQVLSQFQFSLLDNNDSLLLLARTQKAQNKIEAAEGYARWLANTDDKKVRCEYAELLESHEFYARALDEYRSVLGKLTDADKEPKKSDVRFYVARLLLIADTESDEGLQELETAGKEGFSDIELLEQLADDSRISEAHSGSVREIIKSIKAGIDKSADTSVDEQENAGDAAPEAAVTSV